MKNVWKDKYQAEKQAREESNKQFTDLENIAETYYQFSQKKLTNLQNELETEKDTRKALEKFQKELTNNQVQKALLEERIKTKKEKITELRQSKEKLVEKQIRVLQAELAGLEGQLKENQTKEKDLQAKIELLRQGPAIIIAEVEAKIKAVKQKLASNQKAQEEKKWLDEIIANHHNLFDWKKTEKRVLSH